jgi:hypothetical protein
MIRWPQRLDAAAAAAEIIALIERLMTLLLACDFPISATLR